MPPCLPACLPRRFWEATSGICYRTLQYADSQVNKLEITADKTLIAAAGNPHIRWAAAVAASAVVGQCGHGCVVCCPLLALSLCAACRGQPLPTPSPA